jgi:hypothetical protein
VAEACVCVIPARVEDADPESPLVIISGFRTGAGGHLRNDSSNF